MLLASPHVASSLLGMRLFSFVNKISQLYTIFHNCQFFFTIFAPSFSPTMAKIRRIIVHCTGEPDNARRNYDYYKNWFFEIRRWKHFGYHAVVYQDGTWQQLQPLPSPIKDGGVISDATMANGCAGANADSIHVAYVGGIDHVSGRECDTRTQAQKQTLWSLIAMWKKAYGISEVIGHRDWPGVKKCCPCFDAKTCYRNA